LSKVPGGLLSAIDYRCHYISVGVRLPRRWLNHRTIALLSLSPLIFLALALTNDIHNWLWRDFPDAVQSGPAFWPFLFYAFALSLLQLIIYLYLLRHWPYTRWPIVLMLGGHITTRILWLMDCFGSLSIPLNLDTFLIAYMYAMFAIALFVFRIFNPLALARQTVIAQMRAGLVALELHGRVVSMNPAGQAILGITQKYARCRIYSRTKWTFPLPLWREKNRSRRSDCRLARAAAIIS